MREREDETPFAETLTAIPDSRQSLWTIRAEWIGWFYLLLTLQAAPLIFTLWWSENQSNSHDNIASVISAVASGSASLIFVAATATVIELEVIMVLRHLLEKRDARKEREKLEAKFKEGIKQGIERGRQLEREEQSARRNANNSNGNQK